MPTPYTKVVISGTINASEVFAFGFQLLNRAGDQATQDTLAIAFTGPLVTAGATKTVMQSLINTTDVYTMLSMYAYDDIGGTARLVSHAPMSVAGSSSSHLPNQVALVATLRSAVPSRRTRGRMYLPATGAATLTGGFYGGSGPANVAAAVKALMSVSPTLFPPVVVSTAAASASPITSVSVDNRLDIQRRRANKQLPTVTASVALP